MLLTENDTLKKNCLNIYLCEISCPLLTVDVFIFTDIDKKKDNLNFFGIITYHFFKRRKKNLHIFTTARFISNLPSPVTVFSLKKATTNFSSSIVLHELLVSVSK